MPTYRVQVTVELDYEVECDSEDQATEEGWKWEDYRQWSEVHSIDVEDITEPDEEDE